MIFCLFNLSNKNTFLFFRHSEKISNFFWKFSSYFLGILCFYNLRSHVEFKNHKIEPPYKNKIFFIKLYLLFSVSTSVKLSILRMPFYRSSIPWPTLVTGFLLALWRFYTKVYTKFWRKLISKKNFHNFIFFQVFRTSFENDTPPEET
jgi:hypothetical protein